MVKVTGGHNSRVSLAGERGIVELPAGPVAAVVHRGTMEGIAVVFDALLTWTKDSGYTLDGPSRELCHHWDDQEPARHITEL